MLNLTLRTRNSKSQFPISKQAPIFNNQNYSCKTLCLRFGIWCLEFVWFFGTWNLEIPCPKDEAAVYNPKAFIPHAASLRQAFAHCARFLAAASRRSRARVSVPLWGITLSGPLPVVALVGRYPTNKLMGRTPLPKRAVTPFTPKLRFGEIPNYKSQIPEMFAAWNLPQGETLGTMRDYPRFLGLIPHFGVGSYVLLTRSPCPDKMPGHSTCMPKARRQRSP